MEDQEVSHMSEGLMQAFSQLEKPEEGAIPNRLPEEPVLEPLELAQNIRIRMAMELDKKPLAERSHDDMKLMLMVTDSISKQELSIRKLDIESENAKNNEATIGLVTELLSQMNPSTGIIDLDPLSEFKVITASEELGSRDYVPGEMSPITDAKETVETFLAKGTKK